MAHDWQVGDLAECVNDAPCPIYGPTKYVMGHIYRVAAADVRTDKRTKFTALALKMAGVSERWRAEHTFRKLSPPAAEPCEEEFRILLDLSKKRVQA